MEEELRKQVVECLAKLESQFGRAVDEDAEIDGGDAVEFIVGHILEDVRPLMRKLGALSAAQ